MLTAIATGFLLLFSVLLCIFANFHNKMLKMYIHINLHIPKPHSWRYEVGGLLSIQYFLESSTSDSDVPHLGIIAFILLTNTH